MKLLAYVLIVVFLTGIVGAYCFWPSNKDQQPTALFSLLQYVAAFALILLTFLYVTATQDYLKATREQLADQNREPKITVITHHYPQTDPFIVNFEIEIANPSVRATSVTIKSVQIGPHLAADSCFEINQARRSRATIPARELASVALKATFDSVPIELHTKQRTVLTFEDIFHGTLSPVIIDV